MASEEKSAPRSLVDDGSPLRSVLEALPQTVALVDRQRRIRYVNRAPPPDTGLTRESVIGLPIELLIEERDAAIALCERCFETGIGEAIEVRSANGARTHRAQIVPMPRDERGEAQALVIATDVTDQARAREQRDLLVAELDHRVKNTLATVVALADQTLGRADTLADFRQRFLGRVHALARTHEALAASRWTGLDVTRLVQLVLAPVVGERSPLEQDGANPSLPPAIATALASALHELGTNALKHGALAREGGTLSIRSSLEGGALVLVWEEQGGPASEGKVVEGLGLRLVRALVAHELGGELAVTTGSSAFVCRLVVPLAGAPERSSESR